MRRFVVALAPVIVLVAAGCGSSSSSSKKSTSSAAAAPPATTATPAAGGNSVAVSETEFKLTPADPSVKSGKVTIVAKNDGKVVHAINVEGAGAGGKDVRTASIAPGQSASLTVALKPGKTYQWYCPIDGHKGLGMKGTIKVAGASGSAAAAPKTKTSSSSSSSASTSSGGTSTGSSGGGGYGY